MGGCGNKHVQEFVNVTLEVTARMYPYRHLLPFVLINLHLDNIGGCSYISAKGIYLYSIERGQAESSPALLRRESGTFR